MNLYATKPLKSVVKAAATELNEPLSRVEDVLSSYAVRGLRKINESRLRMNRRRVWLHVNKATNSATLPPDFKAALFLGFITDEGLKAPIPLDPEIFGPMEELKEDCCTKCGTAKAVCELMEVTITSETVVTPAMTEGEAPEPITATITTTKRLLPNGDYIEDRLFPVWDPEAGAIVMETTRRVIAFFELGDCGCIKPTPVNGQRMQYCCPEAYGLYYASCCETYHNLGANFFPEDGIIQFNQRVYFDKIALEYYGDLPRRNGDFLIPEVAFEYLVAWSLEKWVGLRKDFTLQDKVIIKQRVRDEKKDMARNMDGLTIFDIFEVVTQRPVI